MHTRRIQWSIIFINFIPSTMASSVEFAIDLVPSYPTLSFIILVFESKKDW